MAISDPISTLFEKYMNDQLTEEEYDQLMEYLATTKGERKFKNFLTAYGEGLEAHLVENNDPPRFSSVWKEAQRRKQQQQRSAWFLRIAASLLLGAGLFWTASYYRESVFETLGFVNYQEVNTAAGELAQLTLPDGSKIRLNEQSTLSYPSNFSKQEKRPVKLKGEAYFEVTPNPDKPFVIETGVSTVQVVGTAFNLHTNPIDSFLSLAVTEGKVAIQLGDEPAFVQAGELGTLRAGQLTVVSEPTLRNYLSWFNQRMVFEDTPLRSIARQLEEIYRVSITVPEPVADTLLSFQIRRGPVAEVLDEIALTLDLALTHQGEQYKLLLRQ